MSRRQVTGHTLKDKGSYVSGVKLSIGFFCGAIQHPTGYVILTWDDLVTLTAILYAKNVEILVLTVFYL